MKSRKTVGRMMMWSLVGLAYFNLFSSLEVGPGLQLGLSGVLPMVGLILYLLRQQKDAGAQGESDLF
jgi:hypothetical protein